MFLKYRAYIYVPTSGKNFIVMLSVVPVILGRVFPSTPIPRGPDAIKLLEKLDAINRDTEHRNLEPCTTSWLVRMRKQ